MSTRRICTSSTAFTLPLLLVWVACSETASNAMEPRALVPTMQPSSAGDDPAPEPDNDAPPAPVRLCPASNLTRACTCDDGAAGRQVCIETRGFQACDCGQLSDMDTGAQGLNAAPEDPPENRDVGVTFDDYVTPQLQSADDCQPGRYVGTFQCNYNGFFEAMGVVSFALMRSNNAEVLEIRDGLLDGWGGAFFFAYLNGDLRCLTGEISGTVDEGFYNPLLKGCSGADMDVPGTNCVITDPNDPDYVPWTVNLSGTYEGALDPATATITGNWSLSPTDLGGFCDGTFEVTLMP